MNRTTIEIILYSLEQIEYKSFVQGLYRADHDIDNTFFLNYKDVSETKRRI